MKYKYLGNTKVKVSSICLGTMTFGEQTSKAASFRMMDYAHEQGINFFDTSFGGIGGSPFINGSSGNLSTEEAVRILKEKGYEIKIDEKLISKTSSWLQSKIY